MSTPQPRQPQAKQRNGRLPVISLRQFSHRDFVRERWMSCERHVGHCSNSGHQSASAWLARRNPAQQHEQCRVPGHLQAEVADLLQRDRENAGDRSDSDPVVGAFDGYLAESTMDGPREGEDHESRRDAHERSTFGQELQVIVVRLGEVLRRFDCLIEERGRPVRVEAGADEGKPTGQPPRIAPDSKTATCFSGGG